MKMKTILLIALFCIVGMSLKAADVKKSSNSYDKPTPDIKSKISKWDSFVKQIPLVPTAKNEALFGGRITRTMTLLASSHLTGRPVRIFFYGQSIVSQGWTEFVIERLKERFPNAEIDYNKRSIGGYQVHILVETVKYDILRERPDLVVFHAYGGNEGQRERLIQQIRRETTAEIMLSTHHLDKRDIPNFSEWHENSSANIRRLAQTYNCELVDTREDWKQYLKANPKMKIKDFIVDAVHLNKKGWALMAQIFERHFRQNTLFPSWLAKNVRKYDCLRSLDEEDSSEIVFSGNGWIKRS